MTGQTTQNTVHSISTGNYLSLETYKTINSFELGLGYILIIVMSIYFLVVKIR